MGNGLLAELQRGMLARGFTAALLLALPVGVAAMIGFSPSASGLSEGLGSLAGGPVEPPAAPTADRSLDVAISSVAAPLGPAGPGRTGGDDGGGGDDAGGTIPGGGGGQGGGAAPGPGGGAPTGGGTDVSPGQIVSGAPDVTPVPVPVPGGGTVDQVLGGVGDAGDAVNGLLGNTD